MEKCSIFSYISPTQTTLNVIIDLMENIKQNTAHARKRKIESEKFQARNCSLNSEDIHTGPHAVLYKENFRCVLGDAI